MSKFGNSASLVAAVVASLSASGATAGSWDVEAGIFALARTSSDDTRVISSDGEVVEVFSSEFEPAVGYGLVAEASTTFGTWNFNIRGIYAAPSVASVSGDLLTTGITFVDIGEDYGVFFGPDDKTYDLSSETSLASLEANIGSSIGSTGIEWFAGVRGFGLQDDLSMALLVPSSSFDHRCLARLAV